MTPRGVRTRVGQAGQQRFGLMAEALREAMPAGTEWTQPEGGMFFWLRLPEGCDAMGLLPKAVAAGLAYVTEDRKSLGLVLDDSIAHNIAFGGLAGATEQQIEAAESGIPHLIAEPLVVSDAVAAQARAQGDGI